MRSANYNIIEISEDKVVLEDAGPYDQYMTITNAAEKVVNELFDTNILNDKRRLIYHDSEGDLTEIKIKNRKFDGFQFPIDLGGV